MTNQPETIQGTQQAYEVLRPLGNGHFGHVFLARAAGDQYFAIKRIPRDRLQPDMRREIINHRMLHHPHVIKFVEVALTLDHLNIVMVRTRAGASSGREAHVWVMHQ